MAKYNCLKILFSPVCKNNFDYINIYNLYYQNKFGPSIEPCRTPYINIFICAEVKI